MPSVIMVAGNMASKIIKVVSELVLKGMKFSSVALTDGGGVMVYKKRRRQSIPVCRLNLVGLDFDIIIIEMK